MQASILLRLAGVFIYILWMRSAVFYVSNTGDYLCISVTVKRLQESITLKLHLQSPTRTVEYIATIAAYSWNVYIILEMYVFHT